MPTLSSPCPRCQRFLAATLSIYCPRHFSSANTSLLASRSESRPTLDPWLPGCSVPLSCSTGKPSPGVSIIQVWTGECEVWLERVGNRANLCQLVPPKICSHNPKQLMHPKKPDTTSWLVCNPIFRGHSYTTPVSNSPFTFLTLSCCP